MNTPQHWRLAATVLVAAALVPGCSSESDKSGSAAPTASTAPAPAPAAASSTRALVSAEAQAAPQAPQQVDIVDAQGFGQPIAAATATIPAGWRTQGGVNWDRRTNCIGNQMRLEWLTSSPDGLQELAIMHGFNWQVQGTQVQMNPCPAAPFASTQAFLQAVVQQRRPGARVVEYRDRADLSQAAQKAAPAPMQGFRMKYDAGQLLVAYEVNGHQVEELFGATVTFSEMQGNVVGGTAMVFAQRAPSGKLDPKLGEGIVSSIKSNPQWFKLMSSAALDAEQRFSSGQRQDIDRWHNNEMARINAQGAADRAAIRSRTQAEIGQINANTNANTQATNDNIHRRNLEAVGETNTFRDASGNTVGASIHGGQRVMRNADGSYTATNNPYATPPPGGEELQRVR